MTRLRISPPPPPAERYEVLVHPGILRELPAQLREAAPAHRYAVVTDANVAPLWGDKVVRSLAEAGLPAGRIVVPAGEAAKTRAIWGDVHDALLDLGLGRDSCIVAVGGGAVGDLAGFVAATFVRGVPIVQVPTTLLAMVDASVGGKTAIDAPAGKNLIGAFHQPRLVLADPETLRTLPDDQLRSGLAEVVKHGAIADATHLVGVIAERDAIFARTPGVLGAVVARSIEIKAHFVTQDPFEQGARKALNAGHTIGHAVELLSQFQLPHGHAVGIGLVAESRAGELAGITAGGTAARLELALGTLGLPSRLPAALDPAAVLEAARTDKKTRAARLHYSLLAGIGAVARASDGGWTFALDDELVARALEQCRERP